ncbi:MAG: UDP-N-acetylmuramoyl-tripeptide--D-alanyl-D-alanine ligase, partial [Bacteroidales bacterium]|nr:UDP-N-acetylmuramoyl-tripeptide--D-alanyl-D-alanine ligase [Bacteroidales bacterium]
MKIEKLYSIFLESTGVTTDSRAVAQGNLFFALKGDNFDGNDYAQKAIDAGAIYAVADRPGLKGDRIISVP